ncbi:MAG: HIRAN domain-containing protein [Bacteroidia bacterium]
MTNFNFLQGKLASGLTSIFRKKPAHTSNAKKVLYEGYIANYQYHQGRHHEHQFEPGTIFSLRHEPENPFDENTVAVFYRDAKIGFVPQHTNLNIAQLLRKGKPIKAKVAKIDPNEEPWARVHMQVVVDDDNADIA